MSRYFTLFIFFMSIVSMAQGQAVDKKETESIKKQDAYWYADHPLNTSQEQNAEIEAKEDTFMPAIFGDLLSFLMWAFIILALIYMLYHLFQNLDLSWNKKVSNVKNEFKGIEINDEKELYDQDYSALIKKALAELNYRLAIRWYYLWVLKELSVKDKIVYDKYKTNNEYKQKLVDVLGSRHQYLPIFNTCVKYYEYIWFGQVNISREQFENIEKHFEAGIYSI